MSLYIGQKVVCIRAVPDWIELGFIGTVSAIGYGFDWYTGDGPNYGIALAEIRTPAHWGEGYWNGSFFRPLVERKTDISIFTKMLSPDLKQVDLERV